jgi:predicted polyphosphate/ATP-dependent NAD kinase
VVTGAGPLGQDHVPMATVLNVAETTHSAEDTRSLVAAMQGKVDLILFCGGDGTARDVAAANTSGVPILGIPAGVKMHSGVFARSPERAGQAAATYLKDADSPVELVEILDIDEAARRDGRLSARLFTVARSPVARGIRQNPKAGEGDLVAETDAALAEYVRRMQPDCLYILGPGTTMAALKNRLGGGTLLGVDLARNGSIIARDQTEAQLLDRMNTDDPARIVLTVVGGQGFILGRGNQQISARVINRVGRERIDVICASDKLNALNPQELTVDTGDVALDAQLSGYWQVTTGPGRRQVVRVVH